MRIDEVRKDGGHNPSPPTRRGGGFSSLRSESGGNQNTDYTERPFSFFNPFPKLGHTFLRNNPL